MAILDSLRILGTKKDSNFMTKLYQNILLYFHCPDITVDVDEN